MEKEIKLSHILKPLYFVMFAILLEMVNFLWLGFKVTGNIELIQVLPKYFFFDLSVYLLVAGIIFISKRWLGNVLIYIFLGLQVAINMINATLYKVFGDIFSFDMMKLGGEAVAAFQIEFIDIWSIVVNILILASIIVLQVLLDRKLKTEITLKKLSKKSFVLLTFFLTWIAGCCSFYSQTLTLKTSDASVQVSDSDEYLWDNMHLKLEAYKKFGTYGFYIKSLYNMVFDNDGYNSDIENELILELADNQKDVNENALLYGDNLIVIMLESFEWFAIDPYNTPTLWNIRTQSGVSVENFYAKNKTNVSEDIVILGNMPKENSTDYLSKIGGLNSKFSLPNLFKSQGYTANYFHSYTKTFYNREVVNKSMGFDNVYGLEDTKLENQSNEFHDWNLESDYVSYLMDKIITTNQKFISFYTTVITHGSYSNYNYRFDKYYTKYDENLEDYKQWLSEETSYIYPIEKTLESRFKQYKCAAMDTDRMVTSLIANLKEKGIHENTSIILYSDHNCYYEDIYFNIKGISKADYNDIYSYNVPCMIYSSKLQAQTIDTFVNTYDIYPTICELYGLPYNTLLTHGYNIFSEEIADSVMVSYLTGIFNDKFYTLNIVDLFMKEGVTDSEIVKFKNNARKFFEKQSKIELLYKYKLLN